MTENRDGAGLYLRGELLTDLIIPEDVVNIKPYAFYGCNSIMTLTLNNNVENVGELAFSHCKNLGKITIGTSVSSIGKDAFNGAHPSRVDIVDLSSWFGITFANYYSNPLWAGSQTWNSENKLITDISVPDNISEIKDYAFYGCKSLRQLKLNDSVTKIGESSFSFCDSLEKVFIGPSVKEIGKDSFRGCKLLSRVDVVDLLSWCNIAFKSIGSNPTYYGADLYVQDQKLTDLTIPEEISVINQYAFSGCKSLKSVRIHQNVSEIGYRAFYQCDGIDYYIIEALEPPLLGSEALCMLKASKIYVPDESLELYKTASGWRNYSQWQLYYPISDIQ